MAATNHECVGKALDLLNQGLQPFVERELRAVYKDRWEEMAQGNLRDPLVKGHWDTQAILSVVEGEGHNVFSRKLGRPDRTLIHEMRDIRNRRAHQNLFSGDDTYRALDSAQRLLQGFLLSTDAHRPGLLLRVSLMPLGADHLTRDAHIRLVAPPAYAGACGGPPPRPRQQRRELLDPLQDRPC
jgi:hypothetical protein